MKNQSPGAIVISLDFELLWGVFDVIDNSKCNDYFKNTREVIPEILKLFENFKIQATWATVGMLFNEDWKEWESNFPNKRPQYSNRKLSSYDYGDKFREKCNPDWFFAPGLIKLISRTPGQEIGTHTYSHYYCQEPGQTLNQFNDDLQKAIELGKKINIDLKSLVFPRNQINPEYLEISASLGIENVRSNPNSWYWKNARSNSLPNKIARTGDAYISIGKKSYPIQDLQKNKNLLTEQMASRFLRPVEKNQYLRRFKIKRILNEMEHAARNKEIYHLWWHPHNYGEHPGESIRDLNTILQHYSYLNKIYNFQSWNMYKAGQMAL